MKRSPLSKRSTALLRALAGVGGVAEPEPLRAAVSLTWGQFASSLGVLERRRLVIIAPGMVRITLPGRRVIGQPRV